MSFHFLNSSFIVLSVTCAGLSACSKNVLHGSKSGGVNKSPVKHTHVANKCIDAVIHSHVSVKKEHLHHYHSCEVSSKNANAHSHPSSSVTGFTRHVHPNGANKHTHVR